MIFRLIEFIEWVPGSSASVDELPYIRGVSTIAWPLSPDPRLKFVVHVRAQAGTCEGRDAGRELTAPALPRPALSKREIRALLSGNRCKQATLQIGMSLRAKASTVLCKILLQELFRIVHSFIILSLLKNPDSIFLLLVQIRVQPGAWDGSDSGTGVGPPAP